MFICKLCGSNIKSNTEYCKKCSQKREVKILKYGESWLLKQQAANEKRRHSNSKQGFIEKHGEEAAAKICEKFRNTKQKYIEKYGENAAAEICAKFGKSTRIDFWLEKGYTKEEAQLKLRERQATGKLENFTKRYGEEIGIQKWQERQAKWKQSLYGNKTEEQIQELKRKQFSNKGGYSKSSQEFFKQILAYLPEHMRHKAIFATHIDNNKNNEKIVSYYDDKGNKRHYFLDFVIDNKVIEFDGDYWHKESRGNISRDLTKTENLTKLGFKILRIKESEYNNNKDKIIKRCLEFIND